MFRRCVIAVSISLLSLSLLVGCSKNPKSENVETETKVGYISNINVNERTFDFDQIEWITKDNTKRIHELGLNEETDFPNGYYRNNPAVDSVKCTVGDDATFEFIDWKYNYTPTSVTFEEFTNQHNEYFSMFFEQRDESFINFTPYWIEFKDDVVISIRQQYVP